MLLFGSRHEDLRRSLHAAAFRRVFTFSEKDRSKVPYPEQIRPLSSTASLAGRLAGISRPLRPRRGVENSKILCKGSVTRLLWAWPLVFFDSDVGRELITKLLFISYATSQLLRYEDYSTKYKTVRHLNLKKLLSFKYSA